MGLLSTSLNTVGLILLTHAVYSSYEHSLTHHTPTSTTASASDTSTSSQTLYSLPADIILETLFSTVLLCVGIVLGSPSLRPIQWKTWAQQAQLDELRPRGKRAFETEGPGSVVGNPFRFLEGSERRGFWDVRGKRKEFADWVRDGSKGDVKITQ